MSNVIKRLMDRCHTVSAKINKASLFEWDYIIKEEMWRSIAVLFFSFIGIGGLIEYGYIKANLTSTFFLAPIAALVFFVIMVWYRKNKMSQVNSSIENKKLLELMDMPIQMFDRRLWAVISGLVILILIGSMWAGTYEYLFPSSFILVTLLFVFFNTKVSICTENLRISTPILGSSLIPKKNIRSIEIRENYANRHKRRSYISLIIAILISFFLSSTFQNPIIIKLYILSTFIFVHVLYATIRISKYPEIIKICAGGKDILFYPRNEHDFLKLKDFATRKLDL